MRFMLKFSVPAEAGNAVARDNGFAIIGSILADLKPEAAYFATDNGRRTGFVFLDIQDNADIPKIAEPFFLAMNATVDFQPVMNAEDLRRAGPAIEQAVKQYG